MQDYYMAQYYIIYLIHHKFLRFLEYQNFNFFFMNKKKS